ncbi:MAG: 3-deoxy-manno-octulosonate cytidylyltransferase [Paramuribaculum sp.]|nr:3-deoxy-manno-octulosonate cytidylyltransferase [Bacteroidales bacterium]MDE6249080.1 3-deoxy-manno-octulosonate cytidylyltransferase [Paramuribaculum sp.]
MNFIAIIPARYASTRFPGKPLADIGGMSMIERVYTQATKALEHVWVATDDQRIADEVNRFGGRVMMTSTTHRSGTDRCCEALEKIEAETGLSFDVVINIQGDEPFVDPSQIKALMEQFREPATDIATLARPFPTGGSYDAIADPNVVKVVMGTNGKALYFSRSVIPFVRNVEKSEWVAHTPYFTHVGMYAYRVATLKEIVRLPQSSLELAESLEQLRWLQGGYNIRVGITELRTIGIDTPEDLAAARQYIASL